MTHTLHRFGQREDLVDDYIVTAMPARGYNDQNCVPKQRTFLETALKYGPVNDAPRRLATMCGHGMVSGTLAKKMVEWVRSGRRTPEQACAYMARFCVCGSFNPARAERVLREGTR